MENKLGSQKQYGVYSRLDILSRETRTYDLWYKNIKLKDIEQSWINYKNNISSKNKREQIKEFNYFIKSINEYIENNKQMTEVDTPYYSYYTEVNQHLLFFVNKLQLDLEDVEGKKIIIENHLSDYKEVDIDDDNLFIKNNDITILTKDEITFINFKKLNYTDIVYILYFIYRIEVFKSKPRTYSTLNKLSPKNPYFDDIKLLTEFIFLHCLNNGKNFNYNSIGKLLERSKTKYDVINPGDDNTKKSYLNVQPTNNNPYVYNIRFTTERQFKEFIGDIKFHFESELSFYLKSENLIELLKLMNKSFKIV